jgi:drug/metabolite transporter (DMT)-like permease
VLPPASWPPLSAVAALLIVAVFSSVLGYLLFFRLISSVGATKTATVSYLIPLFGTLWGVLVLQERVGLETLAGMIVILFGVVLTTGVRLSTLRGGSTFADWRRARNSPIT